MAALAGTLVSFDQGHDLLQRMSGLRLSATRVRRVTEAAGRKNAALSEARDMVQPITAVPWDFRLPESEESVAYVGLDAFSVPMQQPGGAEAEHRMMYLATFYDPAKTHTRYLVDWDLSTLAAKMRQASIAWGLGSADRIVALTDAGNGIEQALHRNFSDDLLCIVDWYHAMEYVHDYSKAAFEEAGPRRAWVKEQETILGEQGGPALYDKLQKQPAPEGEAEAAWESLLTYLKNQGHRMDYPAYREAGLDIGSGPTEAGCKLMAARLKATGMRWGEEGALQVAALRALYESGPKMWDGFWSLQAA